MRTISYIWVALLCWLFFGTTALGQREDKITFNEGVDAYRDGNYSDALTRFESSYERNNKNSRALYNAGNAAYLNGDFEKANQYYSDFAKVAQSPNDIAKAYYNQGNTYLQQADAMSMDPQKMSEAQKLYKNAVTSFKNSLKNNPSDPEAKYNLTYALSKIQQNQNQDQQNQDQNKDQNEDQQNKDQQNQDQNNNDNQDNQNDQNQENEDQNKDGQNDEQDQKDKGDQQKDQNGEGEENKEENENKNGQQDKQEQEQQAAMSKAQAEQDLDAINEDEEKILKKVYGSRGDKKAKVSSGKDW